MEDTLQAPPESPGKGGFKVKLNFKFGGGNSPASSPSTPATATFAASQPVAPTSQQMDWQPVSASQPVSAPAPSTVVEPAPVSTASIPPPIQPEASTSSAAAVSEAPKSGPVDPDFKPPKASTTANKKRKKPAADGGAGKAWRKGLKGYGDHAPSPPQTQPLPKDVEAAGAAGPQAKMPMSMKGPFAVNQPFEPRLPRPRSWTRSPTALKLISGHTLTLPSWQGAANSDYRNARKQAVASAKAVHAQDARAQILSQLAAAEASASSSANTPSLVQSPYPPTYAPQIQPVVAPPPSSSANVHALPVT